MCPHFFIIMKTLICDIDGTLTDMWPVERAVLVCLLGKKYSKRLDQLRRSGISDTYTLYRKVSTCTVCKRDYRNLYNKAFEQLLSYGQLPSVKRYPLVQWIMKNNKKFTFVYATGGQQKESEFVLKQLGILAYFDLENSLDKTRYPFSKKTGLPFKKILKTYSNCTLLTDTQTDCDGAMKASIPYIIFNSTSNPLPASLLP